MRLFKDIQGNNVDPVDHTLGILKEYPYAKIHIGSDSQNVGKKTNYTSVIAYRLGTRGVHYILSKSSCEAINDIWKRLWLEAEYSIKVAEWLTKQVSVQVEIDMDYNSDESFKSNKLICLSLTSSLNSKLLVLNTRIGYKFGGSKHQGIDSSVDQSL